MKDRRRILLEVFKLLDLLIMMGAFALAAWVTFELHDAASCFNEFLDNRIKVQNFSPLSSFL
jgi:hypothetical protein